MTSCPLLRFSEVPFEVWNERKADLAATAYLGQLAILLRSSTPRPDNVLFYRAYHATKHHVPYLTPATTLRRRFYPVERGEVMSNDVDPYGDEESARIVESFIEGADDEIAELLTEVAKAIRDRAVSD